MRNSFELISIIENDNETNEIIKVDILNELFEITGDFYFKIAANDIIERLDICPECYNPVLTRTIADAIGEYHGSLAYEYRCLKYCSTCGWQEDL